MPTHSIVSLLLANLCVFVRYQSMQWDLKSDVLFYLDIHLCRKTQVGDIDMYLRAYRVFILGHPCY